MRESFTEISRLEPLDIFYVGERYKTFFEYPAHCHEVYELNFVENAAGATRTIGDSHETIGNLDLVLITSPKLVHVWEQGTCPQHVIYEITIHIDNHLFFSPLMGKSAFLSIHRMIERAQRGLAFPEPVIQLLREDIINLAHSNEGFASVVRLFNLLNRLSLVEDARELASSSFIGAYDKIEDMRVLKAKEYIEAHYRENINIQQLAELVCMNPDSFSRFFHHKTGRTPNRYIIDYRLGIAARMLLTTQLSVAEIGFSCGFNTLSHFNRLFRESKGCTPSEFRERF